MDVEKGVSSEAPFFCAYPRSLTRLTYDECHRIGWVCSARLGGWEGRRPRRPRGKGGGCSHGWSQSLGVRVAKAVVAVTGGRSHRWLPSRVVSRARTARPLSLPRLMSPGGFSAQHLAPCHLPGPPRCASALPPGGTPASASAWQRRWLPSPVVAVTGG